MRKIYFFNSNTKTLHIDGMCSKASSVGMKLYYTEQEAVLDNGRFIHMCKNCEEEREKIINQVVTERKKS